MICQKHGTRNVFYMNMDKWNEIFQTIENDGELNANNIIEKFKNLLPCFSHSVWDQFDINYRFYVDIIAGYKCMTLLDIACLHAYSKILRILLNKGAKIDWWTLCVMILYSEDFTENYEKFNKIAKILITHEVKMKGLQVKKPEIFQNFNYTHWLHLRMFLEKNSNYWDECVNEIKNLSHYTSYYDILTCQNNQLASHVRKIKKIEKCKERFPIYGSELMSQFEVGMQRVNALNVGEIIIQHFEALRKNGPFVLKIVEFLNNKDIKNLRKAAIDVINECSK